MDKGLKVLVFVSSNLVLKWLLMKRGRYCPRHDFLQKTFAQSGDSVEIIGFGSLMSPESAIGTFPSLRNFKTIRVHGYRRVFSVPGSIFFDHGIADVDNLRIAGLTTEKAEGCSFVAVSFEIEEHYESFIRRENLYDFASVPYEEHLNGTSGTGLMCISSTDETYISRWGAKTFVDLYTSRGIRTIWGWGKNSGIEPCWVYLRHCVLSARALSEEAERSFLDDTYLVDRITTIRQYMEAHPGIMEVMPPASLVGRYSG